MTSPSSPPDPPGFHDDPFQAPSTLAAWTAEVLRARGLDEVSRWRLLEYWFQVELYRTIQSGSAGPWRHLGTYEQPYRQSAIKTKTGWKWADFVLVRDQDDGQRKDLWEEPKGRGRADRPLRVPESDTAGAGDGPQPPPPSIHIG